MARSPCARAASARTAPSARSPACTSRSWTCLSTGLAEAADRTLASADGAHLASYAAAGNGTDAGVAVIVQRMVHAAAAGVALTADPITGDRETTVVTAVRGTGDRLVSGASIGDEWVVSGGTRHRPATHRVGDR